ncbi:MAG TPA: trigger factor [Syntrophales bacterium]|nr:trigger factor [Syntrophales bacterium]
MTEATTVVQIEEISPVQKKLSFDVPWEDVKKELEAAYRQVGKKAHVKGFRQGKVPRRVLEVYYKDQAEGDAVTNLVNRYYWDALQAHEIQAVAQPVIDQKGIVPDQGFSFTATVEVEPVVEPKDYIEMQLEKQEASVSEEDVDRRIEQIREMFATMGELENDRPIARGDFVTFDFQGSLDGVARDEMKADGYFLEVGSGRFIPGFEDQLVGMSKEEEKEFPITFPLEYGVPDLAGKEAIFKVKIRDIREKKLPEVNEEFVKNFEKYENMEEFRAELRKSLGEEVEARSRAALRDQILEKLVTAHDFEIPPSFQDRQVILMMGDLQRSLMAQGMPREQASRQAFSQLEKMREEAKKVVKSILLLKKIAEIEAIDVAEEELEKRILELASRRGMPVDTLRQQLEEEERIEDIRLELRNEKVFDFIIDRGKITPVAAAAVAGAGEVA